MKTMIFLLVSFGFAAQALPRPQAPALRTDKNISGGLLHKASFAETINRYPSPYAMIQKFKEIVPNHASYSQCLSLNKTTASVLGTIDPLRGAALEEEPGALFYSFFENCVRDLVTSGFYADSNGVNNTKEVFGDDTSLLNIMETIRAECKSLKLPCYYTDSGLYQLMAYGDWSQLSPGMQERFMSYFVRFLAGPDVILFEQKLMGADNVFGQPIADFDQLTAFLNNAALAMRNEDKPLKIKEVYAEIAIILALGPFLKN